MTNPQDFSLETLKNCQGWQSRYSLIMQWGKQVGFSHDFRQPENLIKGCESPAWLNLICSANKTHIEIDSDSRIIKGLGVVISLAIEDLPRQDIKQYSFDQLFEELGFTKHLSPSRGNGLKAITRKIQEEA